MVGTKQSEPFMWIRICGNADPDSGGKKLSEILKIKKKLFHTSKLGNIYILQFLHYFIY